MTEALIGAGITVGSGVVLWAGRQFVLETVRGKQGNQGNQGEKGDPGPSMTIRDYRQITDLLKQELNGRYMMADEARGHFARLEGKQDHFKEMLDKALASRQQSA